MFIELDTHPHHFSHGPFLSGSHPLDFFFHVIKVIVSPGVGIAGGWGIQPPPQFMSTYVRFRVKISCKFQYLYKISNISTSEPPPQFL